MRLVAPLAFVAIALALAPVARADDDDAAVLYDPADVSLIDLTLSDEAAQALGEDPSSYVAATFRLSVAGRAFGPTPAEVRLKGHASFRPLGEKAAFKVKFAKEDRLLGLKSLTLNNMVQDPSMVHETLGYEVLRAAGVPAPRTGLAYVRVNEQSYGLYLNLETYDDISLARLFGTTQHLYEAEAGEHGVDVTPGGAGEFDVDEGDEDDRSDLEALIAATNATGSDWSAGMAGTADLAAMTRMWAGEQYVGHWDGYSVTSGALWPRNYYLHSDASGLFTMLASGLDQTFTQRDPFPGGSNARLISRCLGDSSCLQAFRSNLGEVSAAADAIGIGPRLAAIAATVARWRRCPNLGQAADSEWQAAVTATRAFIRDRRVAVAGYLGAAAPVPSPALESTLPPPLSSAGCPLDPEPPPEDPGPRAPDETQTTHPAESAVPSAFASSGSSRAPRRLPRRLTARVSSRSARAQYRLTTSGTLLPPAGIGRARACAGRVTVRVRAGTRALARHQVFLRRNCTFSSSVSFSDPSLFAGRRSLTVQVRFMGNRSLMPRSAAARTVAVRPRAPARSASRGES